MKQFTIPVVQGNGIGGLYGSSCSKNVYMIVLNATTHLSVRHAKGIETASTQ